MGVIEKRDRTTLNFVTVHKGMNSHHDLNRNKRGEMEKYDWEIRVSNSSNLTLF